MDDLVISMHENAVNKVLKNAYKVFQAKLVNKARNYYSRAMELPHHNKFLL